MERVSRIVLLLSLSLFLLGALPCRAEASMLKFWAEGRGDVFSGSSDLFGDLDSPFGGGLEVGLEVLEISIIGELLAMAGDWWLYTVHLGADIDFGEEDSTRFTLGFYTGAMIFEFSNLPPNVDLNQLTPAEQDELVTRTGVCTAWSDPTAPCPGIQLIESELNEYSGVADSFSGWAFGWNIVRLRLALDYPIVELIYLGFAAQIGYHLIITGEEVTAEGKNQAVDSYSTQHGLDPALTERLRTVVGAKPVDTGELDGLNFGIHIYARFEVGL